MCSWVTRKHIYISVLIRPPSPSYQHPTPLGFFLISWRNQLEIFPQYKSYTGNTWDGPCSKVSTPVGPIRTPPDIFRGHERPAEATLTSNGDVSTYVIQARIQTFFRRGVGWGGKFWKKNVCCFLLCFFTLFYFWNLKECVATPVTPPPIL